MKSIKLEVNCKISSLDSNPTAKAWYVINSRYYKRSKKLDTSLTPDTICSLISANSRFRPGIYRLYIHTVSTSSIYARSTMMPPRVLASGPKPCGGKNHFRWLGGAGFLRQIGRQSEIVHWFIERGYNFSSSHLAGEKLKVPVAKRIGRIARRSLCGRTSRLVQWLDMKSSKHLVKFLSLIFLLQFMQVLSIYPLPTAFSVSRS